MTTERDDILDLLRKHRELFLYTVRDLSDEQAAATPTVSELCLGGLVKHVSAVEKNWADFAVNGPADQPDVDWANPPAVVLEHMNGFKMVDGDTLAGLLAAYDEVAEATDALLGNPDLDLDLRHPLPEAPWFEAGASWSARRAFVHIVAETAQHAGHADIIRETIDGQKSMG